MNEILADRPYDPDGRDEIWRRARKQYKPPRGKEVSDAAPRMPEETTGVFKAREQNLILREAVSIAIEALERKTQIPTRQIIADLLHVPKSTISAAFKKNPPLRQKALETARRVRISELFSAATQLHYTGQKITYGTLAKSLGRS